MSLCRGDVPPAGWRQNCSIGEFRVALIIALNSEDDLNSASLLKYQLIRLTEREVCNISTTRRL